MYRDIAPKAILKCWNVYLNRREKVSDKPDLIEGMWNIKRDINHNESGLFTGQDTDAFKVIMKMIELLSL